MHTYKNNKNFKVMKSTFYYSGGSKERHEFDTGVLVNRRLEDGLSDVSDRIHKPLLGVTLPTLVSSVPTVSLRVELTCAALEPAVSVACIRIINREFNSCLLGISLYFVLFFLRASLQ